MFTNLPGKHQEKSPEKFEEKAGNKIRIDLNEMKKSAEEKDAKTKDQKTPKQEKVLVSID